MKPYNPKEIEQKWQTRWEADGIYRSEVDWSKPKHYALTMLPYPSGNLHIGHWFAMAPSDARARYMRMKGYNVLFPMGFDAFGLPAENAAIQRNIHPAKWTYANIERMRGQLRSMGAMFDWQREVVSCDPTYYKWTEWFFKQFYENNLAYRSEALVNWSPTLQTVLANEQVIDGKDERNGQPVIQKMMTQWFFRYTAYADEMLDFSHVDWPEPIKTMETNWIGRSEGAQVVFTTEQGDPLEIYTTRPDTLWGATFMVLSPEHALVEKMTTAEQKAAVESYIEQAASMTEIERTSDSREKTGVFTGGYATNPVNQAPVPIWIADYVLSTYGTGAIMAVPAHDERDFDFARKFGLQVIPVILPEGQDSIDGETMETAYIGAGQMINSGPIDGLAVTTAKGRKNPSIDAAIRWLESHDAGQEAVNYRLRDWLISRQRYWGSPIPIIHKADGTMESVPDEQLPVVLPDDVEFMPSGRSPLTYEERFLKTTDSAGNEAQRETDTMDTFMCSSWYWYRYLNPQYQHGPFDPEEAAYWLPIDVYTGGAEHATMHLLYARWFAKAMRDLGMFDETIELMKQHNRDTEPMSWGEPMLLLRNQGQILGEERKGDFVMATGRWEGEKLFADRVVVAQPSEVPADFDGVSGELMRRTENILHVATRAEKTTVVEIVPSGTVDIPAIPGENSFNQLKHHLEIQRMSKSKGNVVDPDDLVEQYGSDTVRATLMFAFDWQKGGPWNTSGIKGPRGWIEDVWRLVTATPAVEGEPTAAQTRDLQRKTHQTIQACSRDMENFAFNTVIAALMAFRNVLNEARQTPLVGSPAWQEALETMVLLMAPITPHIAEELWAELGNDYSVHQQGWPEFKAELAKEDVVEIAVQINGKVRERLELPVDISQADAETQALALDGVQKLINGKTVRKVIYVPGRLVNIVAK